MKSSFTFLAVALLFCIQGSVAQQTTSVFFPVNQHDLSPEAASVLSKQDKSLQVASITGYTDASGSENHNASLSQNRARSVENFLRQAGFQFDPQALIQGLGELPEPVSQEQRRVEVTFRPIPPPAAAPARSDLKSEIQSASAGKKIALKNLGFVPGEARLLPESRPVVAELIGILNANPKLRIEIQGHICCVSANNEDDLYYQLSTARARTVYRELLAAGIQEDRLSYRGFGGSKPIYSMPERNATEQQANRRVEIEILSN